VFTLEYTQEGLRVLRIAAIGAPDPAAEGSSFGGLVETGSLAPEFVLVDQAGEPFALRDLRGKAVLLDFIFTNCPGPCPLQTASHVRLHRTLDPILREQTHLVSVSLDPVRDTPEALRAYAERLGVDLDGWSFVSGAPSDVDAVLEAYGVGRIASDDAGIDHMLVTYLIDPDGRVAQRYLGSSEAADELRVDVQAALASEQGGGRGTP
jgi:protein SCO1/2